MSTLRGWRKSWPQHTRHASVLAKPRQNGLFQSPPLIEFGEQSIVAPAAANRLIKNENEEVGNLINNNCGSTDSGVITWSRSGSGHLDDILQCVAIQYGIADWIISTILMTIAAAFSLLEVPIWWQNNCTEEQCAAKYHEYHFPCA